MQGDTRRLASAAIGLQANLWMPFDAMSAVTFSALQLAARLALIVGLAVFLGLAFEETYKSEQRAIPGGIRSFPVLAMAGTMLYLIEPVHALAFVAGFAALAVWLYAFTRAAPVTPKTVIFKY